MTAAPTDGLAPAFWRGRRLEDFSDREWEALCDGCGFCCLLKLSPELGEPDDDAVYYTCITCRLLDDKAIRCGDYANRSALVPGCVRLTPESVRDNAAWLPWTCAYRAVAEGRELEPWHPLVSGDPISPHDSGNSILGWTIPEYEVAEDEQWEHVLAVDPAAPPLDAQRARETDDDEPSKDKPR